MKRNIVKSRNYINELIFHIHDSEIMDWVEHICMNEQANVTYAKRSSSSGRFHPKIANEVGGLFHHTKLCILVAQKLCALYVPMGKIDKLDMDIIYASLILHDLWKYENLDGEITKGTNPEHGFVGYTRLLEYCSGGSWELCIVEAVRFHMSNWCHSDEERELAQGTDSLVNQIVMMADMIASEPSIIDYERNLANV